MKILHVITSLQTGGAEHLMVDLLPRLRDLGHEVDLCVFNGARTAFYEQLEAEGIKIQAFAEGGSVYNIKHLLKLRKLMPQYDIVHTHNTACQYFAAFGRGRGLEGLRGSKGSRSLKGLNGLNGSNGSEGLRGSKGLKGLRGSKGLRGPLLITTEHSTSTRRRKYRIFRYIDRWMYKRYDRIICISKPSEESLRNYIGDHYPISTILNGVDVERFVSAAPVILGLDGCKVITMVAGFRYEKDQPTVIRAMKHLPQDYHLVLVGDGSRRSEYEQLIASLDLNDRIHLLGLRNDVPGILKSSDVIVMSSHREGLSLSNVEGMASGRPFVASDVEGLREVTQGAGVLFPHGDDKVLADVILKLTTDKAYREDVTKKCQERARQYDIQRMVTEYYNVYYQLIPKQ